MFYGSGGVCVYSNSRNDVPRVAQRYGTIAAHTRRRASVLVVVGALLNRVSEVAFTSTIVSDLFYAPWL